jgi:flagellar biosynthesis protein FliP
MKPDLCAGRARRICFATLPVLYPVVMFTGFLCFLLSSTPASAQDIGISFGQGQGLTERALQIVALITVLSLAPSILVMVTSFTRIVVVLSLLRTALGTATAPPNAVLSGLALFMTAFIMAPTFEQAYSAGVQPLLAGQIREAEAFERTSGPFKEFMLKHVRPKDLELFMDLSKKPRPETAMQTPLQVVVPAFMISELRRAFEIGFLLFIPFLIIDLVVSSILISMGMMMVPPVTVALPFKLIFFVLVDGWTLVVGSLVQSYGI